MGCVSQFSGTTTVSARGNDTAIQVSGDISMWAQPLTVEYQERDLSLFGAATDTSSLPTSGGAISTVDLPAPTSDAAQTSDGTSTGTSQPTAAPIDTGLSTGAKAGIGAGVAVVALAAIGLLAFFVLKKRRNARKRSAEQPGPYGHAQDSKEPFRQPAEWERRELDASEAAQPRSELDGGALHGSQGGKIDPRLRQGPGQYSELE